MLERDYELSVMESFKRRVQDTDLRFIPERPNLTPAERWNSLSEVQQVRTWLERWCRRLLREEYLNDAGYLRMLYGPEGLDERGIQVLMSLWQNTFCNEKNPTRGDLIRYVITQLEADQPLNFFMSQCLKKGPDVRPGKLNYFLKNQKLECPVSQFALGIDTKGWKELRALTRALPYKNRITMLLGDMDFFTLDGCAEWCTKDECVSLQEELQALATQVQAEADAYFGPGVISVGRWAELYRYEDFLQSFNRAQATQEKWLREGLYKESRDPYIRLWGYGSLTQKMGITAKSLDAFIRDDIVRTAAQYRLEADIIQSKRGVQLWAEGAASPMWPLRISNYDNSGIPPSLLLS